MTETITLYCANHPNVETVLRCNRCEKPICIKCAVKTPTGYRCKECVKSQMKIFDTAELVDYPVGFIVACLLSMLASGIISTLGFIGFYGWFILVIAAPAAGLAIAEILRRAIRRHRSTSLYSTILIALVLGALPVTIGNLLVFNLIGLIVQGIYIVMVIPTVYSSLSGIQLFK
jgi:hypothetical protein